MECGGAVGFCRITAVLLRVVNAAMAAPPRRCGFEQFTDAGRDREAGSLP